MPPMGGVTGAMKGTGGSMGKKKERNPRILKIR